MKATEAHALNELRKKWEEEAKDHEGTAHSDARIVCAMELELTVMRLEQEEIIDGRM